MIDYTKVIELYKELDLNDKRNELSTLIQKIDGLIFELIQKNNIPGTFDLVKNYDINSNKSMTEDESLTFFYEDLTNIKNKILLFITYDSLK